VSGILRRISATLRKPGSEARGASAASETLLREAARVERAGDRHDAAEIYRQVLEIDERNAEAYFRLGEICHADGDFAESAALFERAAEYGPGDARYHYALGCALESVGDLGRAAGCYQAALGRHAGHAAAHNNLGRILQHVGELAVYSGVDVAGLARTISEPGELPASRNPADIRHLGQQWIREAFAHFQTAAAIAPGYALAELNCGFSLATSGQFAEALEHYRRALAIDPELAEAHFNSSLALLAQGRYAEAWGEYEWRWRRPDVPPKPDFDRPEWDGTPLEQRAILLYTEQGYGDSIQFARYASLLASHGARVVILAQPALREVFETIPGVARVVAPGDPLPAFDTHFPLLSLPHALGTTLDGIPAQVPYLSASPGRAGQWRAKLAGVDGSGGRAMKVGLVWASEPRNHIAPMKSVSFDMLAALQSVANVRFYSLQTGNAARQASEPSAPLAIVDLSAGIDHFADTAAIIANLDLVISIDTAVAHLAGAMGKPAWTLLQFAPDWRWYPLAGTSLWYPTMRLYRQPSPGDWQSVVARIANDLREFARREA
jgi:tetratricopeptide (TPR) repeat protein